MKNEIPITLKILMAIVLAVAGGAIGGLVKVQGDRITASEDSTNDVRKRVSAHEKIPAHPISGERIEAVRVAITENKAKISFNRDLIEEFKDEVNEQLSGISVNQTLQGEALGRIEKALPRN